MSQSHEALILIQKMVKVPPTKALLLFNTATYQGLQHTSHSISFILNHLLSSGMLPQAQSLILRLISGRIPSSLMLQLTQAHFTPCSTYTPLYDTVVNAYVHSHSTDQALTFLHHMIHEGHAPLSNTFNNLLCLLIRSNYFDKAWWIFNVLKSKVVLNAYSFGIMITGCCEAGYFVRVFRLLAEGLIGLMRETVSQNCFRSLLVGKNKVPVDVLQYADDTVFFGEASMENVRAVKVILRSFEMVSGLRINFAKSQFGAIGQPEEWCNSAAVYLNCALLQLPFCYLGITIGVNPRRRVGSGIQYQDDFFLRKCSKYFI